MKKNFACVFSLLPRKSVDDMSLLSLAKMWRYFFMLDHTAGGIFF